MKILLTALFCLCLSLPVFADQQTTVLTEQTTVGKASASLPFIDGSNDTVSEKQANALIRTAASRLIKEVGGQGSVSYKVLLNRPSLVALQLEAANGGPINPAYRLLINSTAFSRRSRVFSLPKSTITSNMPGLTVRPVRARRVGWITLPSARPLSAAILL